MGHAHQSTAEVINDPVMVSCTWIKMEYVEETVVGGCPNVQKTVKAVKIAKPLKTLKPFKTRFKPFYWDMHMDQDAVRRGDSSKWLSEGTKNR